MKFIQLVRMIFSVVILPLVHVNSDLFTALVDLEKLLLTSGEIANILESYLEIEEERLEKIKRLKEDYVKLQLIASKDSETFLSNPVNAFLLVKRLTTDWKSVEDLIAHNASKSLMEILSGRQLNFPEDEDLIGAARALVRLQDTYRLDTASLAYGHIEGARSTAPELTAGDCYELGRQTLLDKKYGYALLWMGEALNRLQREDVKTADAFDILELMTYSAYKMDDIRKAVELTNNILEIDPNRSSALENKRIYQEKLLALEEKGDEEVRGEEKDKSVGEDPKETENDPMYKQLCRGEKVKSDAEMSKLSCRYFTNNNPYLLLQPAKEEESHLDPRIVVYHDVLSLSEMQVIKDLARPKLERASVMILNGEKRTSQVRISKSAWISDKEHETIKRISHRIQGITGLSIKSSEPFQVVNYGIGGYYVPHLDFPKDENEFESGRFSFGNRIATWLNYMSDVDSGGATVFPNLRVYVQPEKGSAAFWYNLLENGKGDFRTIHAACPVLAGSKWASNKWLSEYGQEFRRPCNSDPNK